jgi:hypothetical protein
MLLQKDSHSIYKQHLKINSWPGTIVKYIVDEFSNSYTGIENVKQLLKTRWMIEFLCTVWQNNSRKISVRIIRVVPKKNVSIFLIGHNHECKFWTYQIPSMSGEAHCKPEKCAWKQIMPYWITEIHNQAVKYKNHREQEMLRGLMKRYIEPLKCEVN